MMSYMVDTPFGPPVPEIDLPRAPLAQVIGQVRFERVASISTEAFIADFQESIRDVYPLMKKEQQATVLVGPDGRVVPGEINNVLWRFDQDPPQWGLALAPDSVTVLTNRYTRRRDFIAQLRHAITAVEANFRVRFCDRLGVRYINRITDGGLLTRLSEIVIPEVLGPIGTETGDSAVEQGHIFTDTVYHLPDPADLHARWGLLPPKVTFDPGIEASEVLSWVLDLDLYTTAQKAFVPDVLIAKAEVMCEKIYRFFRWTVTDEFLKVHGGVL
jgi:uncharacterized protein (TIGR04255 family)